MAVVPEQRGESSTASEKSVRQSLLVCNEGIRIQLSGTLDQNSFNDLRRELFFGEESSDYNTLNRLTNLANEFHSFTAQRRLFPVRHGLYALLLIIPWLCLNLIWKRGESLLFIMNVRWGTMNTFLLPASFPATSSWWHSLIAYLMIQIHSLHFFSRDFSFLVTQFCSWLVHWQ